MTEQTLKPCPCCNGEAKVGFANDAMDDYTVACTSCGMSSGWFETQSEAIAAWNRRTPIGWVSVEDQRDLPSGYFLAAVPVHHIKRGFVYWDINCVQVTDGNDLEDTGGCGWGWEPSQVSYYKPVPLPQPPKQTEDTK